MSRNSSRVESIEFLLGNVNYGIGLREGGKDGIRATWKCHHCAMMGVTHKPKPTHREALELAKEEVLQHHHAFHGFVDALCSNPVITSRSLE